MESEEMETGPMGKQGFLFPCLFLCPWLGIVEPNVPITQVSSTEFCEAISSGSELLLM